MEKCLVTKLQGIVSNQSLAKIDDFRIKFGEPSSISADSQYVGISPAGIPFRVVNGYLTDENLTVNKGTSGKTTEAGMYFSKGSEVLFEGKSKIEIIYVHNSGALNNSAKEISLKDFKYSKLLRVLDFRNCKVNGNLSDLKKLISLTTILGDNGSRG